MARTGPDQVGVFRAQYGLQLVLTNQIIKKTRPLFYWGWGAGKIDIALIEEISKTEHRLSKTLNSYDALCLS